MSYGYNPYNMNQMMFNQASTIQNLAQTSATQAQIYFVSSPKDMEKVQPTINVMYIGINREKNELYLRQINNAGLIDFNTYTLATGGQEKNEFTKIMERIDNLETKLSKGGINANNTTNDSIGSQNANAGTTAESSTNATV